MSINLTALILWTGVTFLVGLVCLIWPDRVGRYAERVTRYFKEPTEYNLYLSVFGWLYLFVSFACLVALASSLL